MPLIQCLTPFPGGTKLPQGDRIYHFVRNKQGHYVADVLERDVQPILSISQGYQLYDEEEPFQTVEPGSRTKTAKTVKKETGAETYEERSNVFLEPATKVPDKPLHRPIRDVDPRTPAPPKEAKAPKKVTTKGKKATKVVKTPAAAAAE